ncbi:MAG: ABC transporter ATP-binding protein [Acholeplasmataceae bacterium]|nr:ABC transporter ATP-binding protein [Acholeplasmataceae bacterium]
MAIIKTVHLTKMFGEFTAVHNANLTIHEGEINAIVGENGAGKTTLMNMLYGLLKPTTGDIYLRDQKVVFHTPADAIAHGIGMVHQHYKLALSLTVFENVLLGIEINSRLKIAGKSIKLPIVNRKEERRRIQEIIDQYGFNLHADDEVKDLSVSAKQKVEILKMLYRNVDIIIFDEPTAVLTPQESDAFFVTLREMKKNGKHIILITHKLREVMEVSDNVTVIKQGKIVGEMRISDTSEAQIAQLMVGRDVLFRVKKRYHDFTNQPVVYQVENLSTRSDDGVEVVKNVSFSIRQGEIVGVAGVEGNGQTELVAVLCGLMNVTKGKIFLKEKDITGAWPNKLRHLGLAMIPEDRYLHGLCLDMSIKDNIIAGYHDREDVCKYGMLKQKEIENKRDVTIEKYDIRVSDKNGLISSLSGGNSQRMIIAREFEANPDVLIAAQPTRGVDIGAIEAIHEALLEQADKGKTIFLVSSDLSDIFNLSDRILVMYKGEIIGEVKGENATPKEVGLLMAGIKNSEGKMA